jgi:excisionase family DNA binding protein
VHKFTVPNLLGLIDENEAAAILGCAPGTLSVWRSTGRYNLPFVKVGRRVKYRREDVEDFIRRRTVSHTGPSSTAA